VYNKFTIESANQGTFKMDNILWIYNVTIWSMPFYGTAYINYTHRQVLSKKWHDIPKWRSQEICRQVSVQFHWR